MLGVVEGVFCELYLLSISFTVTVFALLMLFNDIAALLRSAPNAFLMR